MTRGQILAWSWAGLNTAVHDFGSTRLDKPAQAGRGPGTLLGLARHPRPDRAPTSLFLLCLRSSQFLLWLSLGPISPSQSLSHIFCPQQQQGGFYRGLAACFAF